MSFAKKKFTVDIRASNPTIFRLLQNRDEIRKWFPETSFDKK